MIDWSVDRLHLDLKLVSVKLLALGWVLPTLYLGFLKSFAFSFFFLVLDPILTVVFA